MDVSDVSEVLAVENVSYPNPWPREAFEHELIQNPFSRAMIARTHEGALAGYCLAWLVVDELHIQNVAVDPDYRQRGLAKRLIEDMLHAAVEAGAEKALLEVRESNEAARRLYRSLGFAEQGRRRRYYTNPVEDAILCQKDLGHVPS